MSILNWWSLTFATASQSAVLKPRVAQRYFLSASCFDSWWPPLRIFELVWTQWYFNCWIPSRDTLPGLHEVSRPFLQHRCLEVVGCEEQQQCCYKVRAYWENTPAIQLKYLPAISQLFCRVLLNVVEPLKKQRSADRFTLAWFVFVCTKDMLHTPGSSHLSDHCKWKKKTDLLGFVISLFCLQQ